MSVEPSKPGIRRCMRCQWLFVSPDVLRIARCQDCKQGEDSYTPRTCSTKHVDAVAPHVMRDTS